MLRHAHGLPGLRARSLEIKEKEHGKQYQATYVDEQWNWPQQGRGTGSHAQAHQRIQPGFHVALQCQFRKANSGGRTLILGMPVAQRE